MKQVIGILSVGTMIVALSISNWANATQVSFQEAKLRNQENPIISASLKKAGNLILLENIVTNLGNGFLLLVFQSEVVQVAQELCQKSNADLVEHKSERVDVAANMGDGRRLNDLIPIIRSSGLQLDVHIRGRLAGQELQIVREVTCSGVAAPQPQVEVREIAR